MTVLRLPLTPAQERRARAGQAAMLRAERDTPRALREATEAALQRLQQAGENARDPVAARRYLLAAGGAVADQLRSELQSAVRQGRHAAREAAYQRLVAEFAAAAKELRFDPPSLPVMGRAPEDDALSESAAEALVAPWRAAVTVAVVRWEGTTPLGRDLRAASSAQAHRLERTAATEIPQAYNAAHDEGAGWVAEQHQEARWLPLLVKRWDATLDRRACERCRAMDGRYTVIGTRFKDRLLPGFIHPRCRCVEAIIPLPLRLRGEAEPGYQVDAERPRQAA